MELLTSPDIWVAFLTLLVLELVLGVDNVVFISILANRLPPEQRRRARLIGLSLALVMRIILLFFASWIVSLTTPLFSIGPWEALEISGRDLILILGGAFLIYKAVTEIHHKLEGEDGHSSKSGDAATTLARVIIQIVLIDLVFSLDSVITAVGMVDQIEVMIAAVVIAIGAMMFLAGKIGAFVDEHPTVKMLALSFLVLIGATLLAEGFNIHISKAAIYGPIAFAIGVEVLNLIYRSRAEKRAGKKHDPVHLRAEYTDDAAPTEQPPTPTVRAFTIAAESGENIQFGDRQIVITPAVKASEGGRLSAYSATFGRGEKADLPAPYEEVWIVIDGQLRIRSDDTVTTARTGDYLHIPDNTPGQVEATEKTVLVCVSVPGH